MEETKQSKKEDNKKKLKQLSDKYDMLQINLTDSFTKSAKSFERKDVKLNRILSQLNELDNEILKRIDIIETTTNKNNSEYNNIYLSTGDNSNISNKEKHIKTEYSYSDKEEKHFFLTKDEKQKKYLKSLKSISKVEKDIFDNCKELELKLQYDLKNLKNKRDKQEVNKSEIPLKKTKKKEMGGLFGICANHEKSDTEVEKVERKPWKKQKLVEEKKEEKKEEDNCIIF